MIDNHYRIGNSGFTFDVFVMSGVKPLQRLRGC